MVNTRGLGWRGGGIARAEGCVIGCAGEHSPACGTGGDRLDSAQITRSSKHIRATHSEPGTLSQQTNSPLSHPTTHHSAHHQLTPSLSSLLSSRHNVSLGFTSSPSLRPPPPLGLVRSRVADSAGVIHRAGSITDWDSQTIIGSRARGPTVTKDGKALNAARRSGAAIETDKRCKSSNPLRTAQVKAMGGIFNGVEWACPILGGRVGEPRIGDGLDWAGSHATAPNSQHKIRRAGSSISLTSTLRAGTVAPVCTCSVLGLARFGSVSTESGSLASAAFHPPPSPSPHRSSATATHRHSPPAPLAHLADPPLPPPPAAGNKGSSGPDHAKIAKLDRENEVAPPSTVSMELGKVLQRARQEFKDSTGTPKPMSQGDLAKAINQHSKVVQEYENMKAVPNPQVLGQMERILKVKLRGKDIGQPLSFGKKK